MFLKSVLVLVAVVLLGLGGVSTFITYRVVTTRNDVETVTPASSFQTSFVNLSFTDRTGQTHEGWLLVGLRGAPAVILCHGYNSNRSDLLALGNLLQQNHFNVYLFNFERSAGAINFSDMGSSQAEDLAAAVDKVTKEEGINTNRVGLFGVNTGAFAALAVAEQNSAIKALVTDTVYENPSQMFESQVDQMLGGGSSQAFRTLPDALFHLLTLRRDKPLVRENMGRLEGIPKLFIVGRDFPLLAKHASELYDICPDPKRLLVLDNSYDSLASGPVKSVYEDQVLKFFLENLPLRAD